MRPNERFSQVVTIDETRWKTDLNKIFEISSNGYFAIEFDNGKTQVIKESFKDDKLLSFSTVDNNNILKKNMVVG